MSDKLAVYLARRKRGTHRPSSGRCKRCTQRTGTLTLALGCLVYLLFCVQASPAASPLALDLGASASIAPYGVDCGGDPPGPFAFFSTSVDAGLAVESMTWSLRVLTTLTDLTSLTVIQHPNARVICELRGAKRKTGNLSLQFGAGVSDLHASGMLAVFLAVPVVPGILEARASVGATLLLGDFSRYSGLDFAGGCVFLSVSVRYTLGL